MTLRLERLVWDGPYAGSFEPAGAVKSSGPPRPAAIPPIAARVVIGLGPVAPDQVVDELIAVTHQLRAAQGDLDPSLHAQLGRYRHRAPSAGFVVEAAAQVGVIAQGASRRKFEAEMIAVAEALATRFEVPIVVLDLQENGATQVVHCVAP
jgi:hypothetical protein